MTTWEGYHKISFNINNIFVIIPKDIFEKICDYDNLKHVEFINYMKEMKEEPHKVIRDNYKKFADRYNLEFQDNSIKLIGKDSLDQFIKYITDYYYTKHDPVFFEQVYRIVVEQLLVKGWPITCLIYKYEDEKHDNRYFIITPSIPSYQRDTSWEALFAYIVKGDKISKKANYYELTNSNDFPMIFIDEDDVIKLKIKNHDQLLVWLFHGSI